MHKFLTVLLSTHSFIVPEQKLGGVTYENGEELVDDTTQ